MQLTGESHRRTCIRVTLLVDVGRPSLLEPGAHARIALFKLHELVFREVERVLPDSKDGIRVDAVVLEICEVRRAQRRKRWAMLRRGSQTYRKSLGWSKP